MLRGNFMKIRNGFVTNSSSSSFVLAYNDNEYKTSIENQIKEKYNNEKGLEYISCLFDLLDNSNNITNLNELENDLYKELFWDCKYELEKELEEQNNGMDYIEIHKFLKTSNGKKMIDKKVLKKIEQIFKSCENYNTIKKIRIMDDYEPYSSLEHRIVSSLNECKIRISHH